MHEKQDERTSSPRDESDFLRARFYALLSRLLACPPDSAALDLLRALDGDETPMGCALSTLREAARTSSVDDARDEYTRLFYGVGAGGELLPYASHYLSGLLYDRPLADLRAEMARLHLSQDEDVHEPEDHIATVLEIMHTLILDENAPHGRQRQEDFFAAHILPWAPDFFAELETAQNAALYVPLGTVGRLLMQIERQAFEMAA